MVFSTRVEQNVERSKGAALQRSTKTVLWAVLGLALLGCLGAGALAWFFVNAASSFGGSSEWSENAVPERDLFRLFQVRLPVKPLHYESRQLGFQDAYFEVLVQLPNGSAEAFLSSNQLRRSDTKQPVDLDLSERIRVLEPTTPALEATEFELRDDWTSDGGVVTLHRSGELIEGAGGIVWIHLTAFET
jgi:hypothetical protein